LGFVIFCDGSSTLLVGLQEGRLTGKKVKTCYLSFKILSQNQVKEEN